MKNMEWELFPQKSEWKEAINYVLNRYDQADKKDYTIFLKELLKILVVEGKVTENEVLTVAICKDVLNKSLIPIQEIENKYGKYVAESVLIITQKQDETKQQYYTRIFTNNTIGYIKTITLAEILYFIRQDEINNTMITRFFTQLKEIHIKQMPKTLCNKIMEELNISIGEDVSNNDDMG